MRRLAWLLKGRTNSTSNDEQAFQELAKGEQTATALENQLSAMEVKIEALLAQAEKEQQDRQSSHTTTPQASADDSSGQQ